MKRRSFIRKALVVAGAAMLPIPLVKAAAKATTALPAASMVRPCFVPLDANPAWINAPYEVSFLFGKDAFKRLIPNVETPRFIVEDGKYLPHG